jgi:hypothetical protein
MRAVLLRCLASATLCCVVGCGGADGPKLAEAGGVVTYQGKAVPNATVVFMPQTGSPAIGTTDAEGRFEFNTQGARGATIGQGTISITAVHQSREVTDEEAEKIGGAKFDALLASIRKSLIPEKYSHPQTSGLTANVTEDPEKNKFPLDLK